MRKLYSKSREESAVVTVDWNLGNVCNLHCDYCHSGFHRGDLGFPDLDKAKLFVDRVIAKNRASNRGVRFSFVGGEPTLYEGLPALCEHIKTAWYSVHVMSNGTAPLTVWDALIPHVDSVALTYHARADFAHVASVAEAIRKAHRSLVVIFAMDPRAFADQVAKAESLRDRGFQVELQPLYRDHVARSVSYPYTAEQMALLFPQADHGDIILEGTNAHDSMRSPDEVIHRKANSFTGMKCAIGLDQLVIDPKGNVWGGWCRVGGIIGNIHVGDFEAPREAFTCTKATCNNPLDLSVAKWEE